MRFHVQIEWVQDAALWEASFHPGDLAAPTIHTRRIRRRADDYGVYPLPPDEAAELAGCCGTRDCANLCTTGTNECLRDVEQRLMLRLQVARDIVGFGQYLFATLLGEAGWNALFIQAAGEAVELVLRWGDNTGAMSRLPWEMMHHGADPVLIEAGRNVTISRVVVGDKTSAAPKLPLPLKVLVVVGSALNDPKVRPGAEYLGLLRRIELTGGEAHSNSRLLVSATTQQMEDEIRLFQPSVIHIISHGQIDRQGNVTLQFKSDDKLQPQTSLGAQGLLDLLRAATAGQMPTVVVMNACFSAVGAAADDPANAATTQAIPLAEELVRGGVPVVVGMAGEVTDRACRMFTQRFYEALLAGESVTLATAQGRRAALLHGGIDRTLSADWAFPTIFLSDKSDPQIGIDPSHAPIIALMETLQRSLRLTDWSPRSFCGRVDCLTAYHELMRPLTKKPSLAFCAMRTDEELEQQQKQPRYGLSRVLERLALQSVRDGHIPILLAYKTGAVLPTSLWILALQLLGKIVAIRLSFRLDIGVASSLQFLLEQQVGANWQPPPAGPNPESTYYARLDSLSRELLRIPADQATADTSRAVGAALREDLRQLCSDANARYPAPADRKVLLLIDDAHKFAAATRLAEVLTELSSPPDGVVDPLRVIIAYSGIMRAQQDAVAIAQLNEFSRLINARYFLLDTLPSPLDDRVPYLNYLLYYDTPLVLDPRANPQQLKRFFERLHGMVRGAPSRLALAGSLNGDVKALVDGVTIGEVLIEANDESVLQQLAAGAPVGPALVGNRGGP